MSIHSAVGYSENIDEAYEAGLEIGGMILEKIALQANSVGILFCHIEFDFAELLKGIREKLDIPILETKKEIELILNNLPADCAVNGFYTNGELGPIDSSLEQLKKSRYHNTTLVLCAF